MLPFEVPFCTIICVALKSATRRLKTYCKLDGFHALPPGFPSLVVGYGAKGFVSAPGPALVPPPGLKTN